MKICNVCKTVLEDSAAYCPRCNSQSFSPFQTKRCPFCNSTVAVGTIVCPNCHKILPPEEYIEMKFTQPVVQPIYVPPVEAPKTFVAPKLSEDFVAPEVPKEPVVEKTPQVAPPLSVAPSFDFGKGHEFNPFERPIERKDDNEPLDNIILGNENENFGRPEQYAELFPNEIPPINKDAYDLSAYEKTPFKPIAVKDTLDNLDEDNQESGKVVGFSESSAKLNAKINSKISKTDQENKKKNKNGKNETDRLFGEINRQFDSEEFEPQVVSREEAEKQNTAGSPKSVPTDQNVKKSKSELGGDDEIVKNAFSNLSGDRTVYRNDGGSPTYIYNQIFPNQNAEQRQGGSTVFKNTVDGAPNISTVNEKGAKPIRQRTAGSGIAALMSLIFIIGGLALSLVLVDINFYYDKITGIQLAAASLGQTVFDMFPSNYWAISFNGFLSGIDLTIYELFSPLYLASVITAVVAIVTHLFCFKPSKAKKIILLVLSLIIFAISLAITLSELFIFNYATIGYGVMIFAFASLLSMLTLIIGYKNKV